MMFKANLQKEEMFPKKHDIKLPLMRAEKKEKPNHFPSWYKCFVKTSIELTLKFHVNTK